MDKATAAAAIHMRSGSTRIIGWVPYDAKNWEKHQYISVIGIILYKGGVPRGASPPPPPGILAFPSIPSTQNAFPLHKTAYAFRDICYITNYICYITNSYNS